jgi:hypothetical protein
VFFEPLDLLARSAALVPRPRVNLTGYHGVFAPSGPHRALVTKAGRGKGSEVYLASRPAPRMSEMVESRLPRHSEIPRVQLIGSQAVGDAAAGGSDRTRGATDSDAALGKQAKGKT